MKHDDPLVVLGEGKAAEVGAQVLFREARHHHVMVLSPFRQPRPRFTGPGTLHVDGVHVPFDGLLLALPGSPASPRTRLERLGVGAAGIAHAGGRVAVDARGRSITNPRVFAVGAATTGGARGQEPSRVARAAARHLLRCTETRTETDPARPSRSQSRVKVGRTKG